MNHGTLTSYQNYGCRCETCRAAYADYQRGRVRVRKGTPRPTPATPEQTMTLLFGGNDAPAHERVGTWASRAECAGVDPELFFPERGEDTSVAKAICAVCPVIDECLTHAIANDETYGIWGGKSERERRAMQRTSRLRVAS